MTLARAWKALARRYFERHAGCAQLVADYQRQRARADAEKRRADEAEANARRSEAHCRRAEDVARAVRAKNERLTAALRETYEMAGDMYKPHWERLNKIRAIVSGALESVHDDGLRSEPSRTFDPSTKETP